MTEAVFTSQAPNPFMARLAELLAKIKAGMEKGTDAPLYDPMTGDTLPAGASLQAVSELSGLPGMQRLFGRMAWGHPAVDASAPSLAGKYSDILDATGLAAGPAVGLAKGAPRVAKGVLEAAVSGPTPGSRAAQRGAIRAGGDPKLQIAHATTVAGLEQAYRGLGGSALYSPSLGIRYDQVPDFMTQHERGTVLLIPKLGAFDPATSTSTLYNRDAYLPRHGQFPGVRNKTGPNLVFDRGLVNVRLPASEGQGPVPRVNPRSIAYQSSLGGLSHRAALANSPHFRSYADFEASPAGAATLIKGRKDSPSRVSESLLEQYGQETFRIVQDAVPGIGSSDLAEANAFAQKLLYAERPQRAEAIKALNALNPKLAEAISRLADTYRGKFAKAPSEYAELQHYGLTPLTQENWAGAFVTGGEEEARRLQKVMGLPIEAFRPGSIKPQDMNDFQQQMGLARRQPIGVGLASGARLRLPEIAKQKTLPQAKKAPPAPTEGGNISIAGKNWPLPEPSSVDVAFWKKDFESGQSTPDDVIKNLLFSADTSPEAYLPTFAAVLQAKKEMEAGNAAVTGAKNGNLLIDGKNADDITSEGLDAWEPEFDALPSPETDVGAIAAHAKAKGSLPDLLGEAPAPDASLKAKFGSMWDVVADDQEVAQHLFEQYGNTLEGEKFLPILEKLPSWSQDNVIKAYMKLAGKEKISAPL